MLLCLFLEPLNIKTIKYFCSVSVFFSELSWTYKVFLLFYIIYLKYLAFLPILRPLHFFVLWCYFPSIVINISIYYIILYDIILFYFVTFLGPLNLYFIKFVLWHYFPLVSINIMQKCYIFQSNCFFNVILSRKLKQEYNKCPIFFFPLKIM